jgi:hypothetical protein
MSNTPATEHYNPFSQVTPVPATNTLPQRQWAGATLDALVDIAAIPSVRWLTGLRWGAVLAAVYAFVTGDRNAAALMLLVVIAAENALSRVMLVEMLKRAVGR